MTDARTQLVDVASGVVPRSLGARMLHALFEEQVRAFPDASAVILDDHQMSYSELNARANRLAHCLKDRFDVGAEDLVGIIVDRSERMLIGILGVLKAGAGYVPIDPLYPANAIQHMLRDADARVLLVDSQHLAKVGGLLTRSFVLDVELDALTTPETDLETSVGPSNLAYSIYTSGSTGRRKGVVIEHRAIVNTISWRKAYYGISSSDVAVQIPSYALDSSVADIFTILLSGATLVLLREDSRTNVNYIRQLVDRRDVTHLLATPTFYKLLLPALEGTTLKCVTVAGEATTPSLVEDHFRTLPETRLVNEYGPTENAVCSTAGELVTEAEYVSIGTPISNVEVMILDENLRPVDMGAEGEMYVGGKGLARSYLNRPDLTAERLVPHPYGVGQRLYRTGDVARPREDGGLEFLGRMDDQVKLRGFRVELGEIESVLRRHPKVEDAVVICRDTGDGEKRVLAYVVEARPVRSSDLKEYLGSLLPEYMLPSAVLSLERIPMNPNGKVDRAALPDPDAVLTDEGDGLVEPRNETEEILLGLWSTILNVSRVGVQESFFDIGGNSLKAAQLQAEIYSQFGYDISLHELFDHSTIAGLAAKIAEGKGD